MRPRALLPLVVCLVLGATASAALASPKFRPRVGGAMGLVPTFNKQGVAFNPDIASGGPTQVTYHGGSVMSGGVTVHAIFWDGGTNPFSGSPQAGVPDYEGLINQFFGDVAHDSTHTSGAAGACTIGAQSNCNVFTALPAYAEETAGGGVTSGSYDITYATPIIDHDAYPPKAASNQPVQCQSANNTAVCITDGQIQTEIDNEITATGGSRGLNNLWFVFLPAGVDECITPGVCGTNDFGAYHSDFDDGHGTTIYAIAIDPVIEVGPISQGSDPQGNPDAEAAADAAGHETVEAITDPTGVGWLDSNGFEVADKCEFGSQFGTILGNSGPDNADYNQMINGHAYLEQEMWSLGEQECVQGTTDTTNPLPLPQVNLTQFSPTVTGNIGSATQNVGVTVTLVRSDADGNPVPVASNTRATDANGNWTVPLSHAVGDDRDEIDVDYSDAPGQPGSSPMPNHQVILTGNGGNPFTESGWTGWTALDNGYLLTNDDPTSPGQPSVTMGPCFQTGVLGVALNGSAVTESVTETSPTQFCSTALDTADYDFASPLGPGDVVTTSSNDNRAFQGPDLAAIGETSNPNGGLVNLTIQTGEPDASSAFVNPLGPTFPVVSGFPTCTADLGTQTVTCTGLVADSGDYTVNGNGGTTDDNGTLVVPMSIHRGDSLALSNGSRTLTTLHVANLQVNIVGDGATVASGTCAPGEYYGAPLTSVPTNVSAGDPSFLAGGAALTGEICPTTGDATGLPTAGISQTDDTSGGQTMTEVADVADTSPMEGETVYGAFTALAEATDGSSPIALNITRGASSVFSNSNVDTSNGVNVPALSPGSYTATWTVRNVNGDTRTETSRFIEQPALQGAQGPQGPQGPAGPQGPRGKQGPPGPKPKVTCKLLKHNKIQCTVKFPKKKHGKLRVTVSRGGRLVALGHANVVHGQATLTMSELRTRSHGAWRITVVFSQTVQAAASTQTLPVRVR
jgi:hypothetical protein